MARRVIVDENVGPNTRIWREFQRALGGQPWEFVFLSKVHPGIPDVEILDKLLQPGTVLLTGDSVLHERAIQKGIRSYTLDQRGQLTRQRQPRVTVSTSQSRSVHTDLQDDYRHKADHTVTRPPEIGAERKAVEALSRDAATDSQPFRVGRRISQVAVTIGSKATRRGFLCGFVFQVAGNSGRRGCEPARAIAFPLLVMPTPHGL